MVPTHLSSPELWELSGWQHRPSSYLLLVVWAFPTWSLDFPFLCCLGIFYKSLDGIFQYCTVWAFLTGSLGGIFQSWLSDPLSWALSPPPFYAFHSTWHHALKIVNTTGMSRWLKQTVPNDLLNIHSAFWEFTPGLPTALSGKLQEHVQIFRFHCLDPLGE